MSIKILFFASLREQFGVQELSLPWPDLKKEAVTVNEVWQLIKKKRQLPINVDTNNLICCAVNCEMSGFENFVHDEDEVAFFPPVTGG